MNVVINDAIKINETKEIDEIDKKIALLIEQKKQYRTNQTKYEEFMKKHNDSTLDLVYYFADDVEIFKLLCKERPFEYDRYLLIKRALKNKNLALVIEIVLQGFKLYRIDYQPYFYISNLYWIIIGLCIQLQNLNALKFFHENMSLNFDMDLRTEILEKTRESYYEIVKPYCDEKYFVKLNEYKVKTQANQNQSHVLKNSNTERFNHYMEMLDDFNGLLFDWIFEGFRTYCNFDQIYQNDNKIRNKIFVYVEKLVQSGNIKDLKIFDQIFNLKKLYKNINREHLKIMAIKFGFDFYQNVTNILGHFQQYDQFPKFMFDIEIELFKYMFKNLNWQQFSNHQNWDHYRDFSNDLILLAEEKNKEILTFLVTYKYPWNV